MLEVGEYKNYKELCRAMGWKPVGGDTKVKHLKELESICKYHKDGYKFIIKEVYETPLPIMDNRKELSLLVTEIQYSLLKLLIDKQSLTERISKTKLMFLVGLLNTKEYFKINDDREEYSKETGIHIITVNFVLDRIYNYADKYLARAIKYLENNKVIQVKKDVMYVCVMGDVEKYDKIKEVSRIERERIIREATSEEIELIMQIERECLDVYGKNPNYNEKKKAREEANDMLSRKHGIHYHYLAYDFTINRQYIEHDLNMLANQVDELHREIVNQEFKQLMENSFTDKDSSLKPRHKELNELINTLTKELSFFDELTEERVFEINEELKELKSERFKTYVFENGLIEGAYRIMDDVLTLKQ